MSCRRRTVLAAISFAVLASASGGHARAADGPSNDYSVPRRLPTTTEAAVPLDDLHAATSGQTSGHILGREEESSARVWGVFPTAWLQPSPDSQFLAADSMGSFGAETGYGIEYRSDTGRFDVGADLYSTPEFDEGLVVRGRGVAMKIGGYVKADFIYDFNAIDSTDSFVTTEIPVGAPQRTNARYHSRQTFLSADVRWPIRDETLRVFVEGDFFGENNNLRLRHAYGETESLLVGQTWTTFTDVAAAPATLDFEGSVSSVNRRQAQARWTTPVLYDDMTMSLAVEDTRFIIASPVLIPGEPRSPSPDLVGRLRLRRDWGQFQIAGLQRIGGFQPQGQQVETGSGWGLNATGVVLVTDRSTVYYQVLFGDGIGSYRSLPDAVPSGPADIEKLGIFAWMVGMTADLTERVSSNVTYAQNELETNTFQPPDSLRKTTYLAANLIWSPVNRINFGVEYLYGVRQNYDGASGAAHRLQSAFFFHLP